MYECEETRPFHIVNVCKMDSLLDTLATEKVEKIGKLLYQSASTQYRTICLLLSQSSLTPDEKKETLSSLEAHRLRVEKTSLPWALNHVNALIKSIKSRAN